MIKKETTNSYKVTLINPDGINSINISFVEETFKVWEPYLIKIEAMLLSETYKKLR